MSVRVYVGNLDPSTTAEELRAAFEAAGHEPLEVELVRDPITGRRRGFGFVELADEHVAASAMEALDGRALAGRKLSVEPVPGHPRTRFVGE